MNRRQILKAALLSPLLGLFKKKEEITVDKLLECKDELSAKELSRLCNTTGTSSEGPFWMQTYGPHYDPSSFGFDWTKADSSLLGIYHGEELKGIKAIDCPIGDRIVLADGRRYMCYGPNATEVGIHKKGKGVFLRAMKKDE